MKKSILFVLVCLTGLLFGNNLKVYIEDYSFLSKNGTVAEIGYKIPYEELGFVPYQGSFWASVDVTFELLYNNQSFKKDTFNHSLKVSDFSTKGKNILNKIYIPQKREGISLKLSFFDKYSQKSSEYVIDLDFLDRETLMSSLELSNDIREVKGDAFDNLKRNDKVYFINPGNNFYKSDNKAFLYFEYYNLGLNENTNKTEAYAFIELSKDDKPYFMENKTIVSEDVMGNFEIPMDIKDLEVGTYSLNVKIIDKVSMRVSKDSTLVFIKEEVQNYAHMFDDIEKDLKLLSYVVNRDLRTTWNNLTPNGKKNFIDYLWKSNDPNRSTVQNEFMIELAKRVDEAKSFSSIGEGWMTDQGRIYIRNGKADTIESGYTDPASTNYMARKYEIWKYDNSQKTYIFLDRKSNGELILIYAENDDLEQSLPNWTRYVGDSFDTSSYDTSSVGDEIFGD